MNMYPDSQCFVHVACVYMYMYTILQSDVLHIPVLSKHGQLYSCTLPPLMKEEDGEGEPFFETLPNVTSLLEPLSQQECLIKVKHRATDRFGYMRVCMWVDNHSYC